MSFGRFLWLFILLLSLAVLPLANSSIFLFNFEFSKILVFYFFGICLLFLSGIYLIKTNSVETLPKFIFLPLISFLTIYTISSIFSINPLVSFFGYFGSFSGGLIYVLFLLIYLYSAYVLKEEKKVILQTIFLSGVLVGLYGLWQYGQNFLATHQFVYRIYSTIGQPNRLAFFLLAVVPISFFLFWEEKKNLLKTFYGLGTVITLLAFFLTFSRSAYIVLLITTLLTVLILLKRHSGEPKGRLQNLIKDGFWTSQNDERIISKILLIIIIFGFIIFGAIFLRSIPSTVSNFSQSSLSLRLAEWQGSWSAVINRPWWRQLAGYGPETVYYTFFKYRPAVYNYSAQEQIVGPNQIRNYYLHLLSGIGLIGLILYLWIYFKILRRSYKNSRDNILDTGIFFSLLAIALYSFFYYQTESVLPLFWVLAGVSLSGGKIHFNNIYHYSGKLLGILFIVLAPFLFYGLGCAAVADYYGSSYPSEQNFLQAVKLNPIIDAYQRNLSKLYMLEMLSLKDNNKNLALKKYLQGKEAIDKALAISPLDIRNQRQLVLVNYYAGVNLNKTYQKENIPESVKLVHMAPSDYMSWDMLGLVYLNVGDLNQARSAFLKERSLNSSGPGVWLHLGEVSKQQGKLDEAINYYETAVRISHNWGFAVNELNKALELKHNFLRTK